MQSKVRVSKILFNSWLTLPILAIFIFGTTKISSQNPQTIEFFYSQKLYPKIATVLSFLSNSIPFSLDDLFYLLLIITAILFIALLLFKKISFKKTGKIILNISATVYTLFYVLWGFNYYREGLNKRLQLAEQNTDTQEFIVQLETLVKNTNNSFCSFEKMDNREIDVLIEKSYKKLAPVLKLNYPSGKRTDKKITFSSFFAKAGISGYYGPFFNEVHVNKKVLNIEYPFVLAHEKAHQFGITSEAEANFYAWLVCSNSKSEQLQYSANLQILRFFIYQSYQLKKYPEIISKLNENVKNDLLRTREYWMNLRNEKVDKVASKINDTYLKTNNVEKGIEDYRGVVKFIMDFQLDTEFQEKYNLNLN